MPTKKKRAKLPSCTVYAIRKGGKWYTGRHDGVWGTFARAYFWAQRPDGVREIGEAVVPCRVRPLPSAKRNRTRTR